MLLKPELQPPPHLVREHVEVELDMNASLKEHRGKLPQLQWN
jgi:hypothetical protein